LAKGGKTATKVDQKEWLSDPGQSRGVGKKEKEGKTAKG